MSTRSWLRNLFPRKTAPVRKAATRCRLTVESLEDRVTPATLTEAGTTLNIALAAGEQLTIVSNGGTYSLTSNQNFVDGGVTAGRVTGFGTTTASVTVAGLAAYDTINFLDAGQNTQLTFGDSGANAYSDAITVSFDDDTAIGAGEQSVTFTGSTTFTGTNGFLVTTTRNIVVSGATVSVQDGNIALFANVAGTTAVVNDALLISANSTVQATGSGSISLTGHGGNAGIGRAGVNVALGSKVLTDSGSIMVNGTGGANTGDNNPGVEINGAGTQIHSASGNVTVTGQGGGTGASRNNRGIEVATGAVISADGAGTVSLTGTGGASSGGGNIGILVDGGQIRTDGTGLVTVSGTGGSGTGALDVGILVRGTSVGGGSAGVITSSSGNVVVTGQGGGTGTAGSGIGVFVVGGTQAATITTGGSGTVTINGTGGGGTGTNNSGVIAQGTNASISTSGTGLVSITGTAGSGTAQFSLSLASGGSITTQTGGIAIDGRKSSGSLSGDVQLQGAVTSVGANVSVQADRDILGNATGTISTGAGGGDITLSADQDGTGTPNDAGTIQLAGDLTAGTGIILLSLTDTDGFLSGNIVSAGQVLKAARDGTLQMNGAANTYLGTTTVLDGTLLVNGTKSGAGATTVESGAVLGGTGSIAGTVTINTGGTITGGTVGGVGTLTVGSLSFNGGTYSADLSGTTSDTIVATGTVDLQAPTQGVFTLNAFGGPPPAGTVFTLIDNQGAGAIANPPLTNAPEGGTVSVNGFTSAYSYVGGTGNDFVLQVFAPDLAVSITADKAAVFPGDAVTYTVTVANLGPGVSNGVTVSVPFSALLTDVTWTAAFAGGATGTASGTGNINQMVDLPNASTVTYTVRGVLAIGARTSFTTTAQITTGATPDPNAANDTAAVTVTRAPEIEVVGAGAGGAPVVLVYSTADRVLRQALLPYPAAFTGGVTVAQADMNGDGVNDVITASGRGSSGLIRIFDGMTGADLGTFFAFPSFFLGGAYVAAGDVVGDSRPDIVVGAGPGALAAVFVFDGGSLGLASAFLAYPEFYSGGVTVAVGNVDGVGRSEIVTGPATNALSLVAVYDGAGGLRSFFAAFPPNLTGGVNVAVGDVDGDGDADIIAGLASGFGPLVAVYDGSTNGLLGAGFAFEPFLGGVRVGASDSDGDGVAELLIGAGPGANPHVKRVANRAFAAVNGAGKLDVLLESYFAFGTFAGGVYVA